MPHRPRSSDQELSHGEIGEIYQRGTYEGGLMALPPTIRVVQNWHEEFRDREQDYGMHP